MVTVAVPGGTGGVGRTIMDALKESGKHKAIAFSRKAPKVENGDAPVLAVDYSDVDSLTKTLEEYNVDVVISTIFIFDEESGATETNLVKAAEKSKTTKRFVISNWGIPLPPEDMYVPPSKIRLAVIDEIRKTSLEWTEFYNGFFLDYYGMPHIESHMNPFTFVVDMASKTAVIPATGNEPLSLTYTHDLGKFVVAALDLPQWKQSFGVYSENITWNEFIKRAEKVVGTKFQVTYDSVEKLQRGEITDLPSHVPDSYNSLDTVRLLQAKFGIFVVHGLFLIKEEDALNSTFPEIQTTTVESVLSVWKGK